LRNWPIGLVPSSKDPKLRERFEHNLDAFLSLAEAAKHASLVFRRLEGPGGR
jgi:hypothetical protein